MSLLKRHLEDYKATLNKELAEVDPNRKFYNQRFDDLTSELEEIAIAIAALEPAPIPEPEPALPSMDDIIDPDFTGGLQTEVYLERLHAGTLRSPDPDEPDDASEFAEPDDEAQRAAAIELTADVEPVAASWIDQQTCEPVEPEPTEGYAPVTNPEAHIQAVEAERYAQPTNSEADFWARGLASDQKPQSRFNIFRHKREDA
jgi:hypothetical protein